MLTNLKYSTMKTYNRLKITFLSIAVFAFASVTSSATAQTTKPSNQIATVEVSNNDGFKQLRNLLEAQFDFTNPQMQQGLVNSQLTFSVSDAGKLTNIVAKSDCKYVSEELKSVLEQLHYRVDVEDLKVNPQYTTFSMPVQVLIANR